MNKAEREMAEVVYMAWSHLHDWATKRKERERMKKHPIPRGQLGAMLVFHGQLRRMK